MPERQDPGIRQAVFFCRNCGYYVMTEQRGQRLCRRAGYEARGTAGHGRNCLSARNNPGMTKLPVLKWCRHHLRAGTANIEAVDPAGPADTMPDLYVLAYPGESCHLAGDDRYGTSMSMRACRCCGNPAAPSPSSAPAPAGFLRVCRSLRRGGKTAGTAVNKDGPAVAWQAG